MPCAAALLASTTAAVAAAAATAVVDGDAVVTANFRLYPTGLPRRTPPVGSVPDAAVLQVSATTARVMAPLPNGSLPHNPQRPLDAGPTLLTVAPLVPTSAAAANVTAHVHHPSTVGRSVSPAQTSAAAAAAHMEPRARAGESRAPSGGRRRAARRHLISLGVK